MDNAYQTSWQAVCDEFDVDPGVGLQDKQVEEYRKKHGVNGKTHTHTHVDRDFKHNNLALIGLVQNLDNAF